MWGIIPVKQLQDAKYRLSDCLSQVQRTTLSLMMLRDVLDALTDHNLVEGVVLISSDKSLFALADEYDIEYLLTESDAGYSEDALKAIESISKTECDSIAIIPGDVPLLSGSDVTKLKESHKEGITLCPALADGGTNGFLFSTPLKMPLLFGLNSLKRYENKAAELGIPCQLVEIPGLERDIDTPEDIRWLLDQEDDSKAIQYLKSLNIPGDFQKVET